MNQQTVFLIIVCTWCQLQGGCAQSSRPHIIVILADDLGWNDVSFHGSNQIPTPALDTLAYTGVMLSNYYVSPICTPSRSALLTGRHPIHTGLQHGVLAGAAPYGLGLNETIMPQYLKRLGYETHMVGKWHLGFFKKEYTPTFRGFDSHFGYWLGKEGYSNHKAFAYPGAYGLDFRRDMALQSNYSGRYSTELFTEEATKIIQRHDTNKPLFLYLPHQAVHSANPWDPLEALDKYYKLFPNIHDENRRKFAAMAAALDDSVKNVTKALNERGMLNNSVIVFSTDNGGPAAGFNANHASNWPLRGVKTTLWEGGVRGAGFIWSPLIKNSARKLPDLMHICDWLPTLYHIAGGDSSTLKNLDGFNVWNTLSQDAPTPRVELLHNIDPMLNYSAVRVGEYKLILGNIFGGTWDGWYAPEQYHLLDETELDRNSLQYKTWPDISLDSDTAKNMVKMTQSETGNKKNDISHEVKPNGRILLKRSIGYSDQKSDFMPFSDKLAAHFGMSAINSGKHAMESGKSLKNHGIENDVVLDKELLGIVSRYIPVDVDTFHLTVTPDVVTCGAKPANASTNCQPTNSPCLYHIVKDPCEYNNIANENPQLVAKMLTRLREFNATAVPPRNKPQDLRGLPIFNNGAWGPWMDGL
ncbi:arylsulfatase J-like isoform X1 [Lingula anatina]|uniref:Arylsulfatase J-like isoform X1 n=1 Tax=Lingula anatina TaxID=7574 RepID=A0A1S3I1S9_LINAN|nr:arylsulfatase J-like isoform X1 [Lingula anatina]XP_013392221.1 arylsulfatase J-like isoform X1 [Lingula anatina]XP_013392222.1 arylsulfatase J-like isoform X1 [Lingula anatina]|eukprot:XP_013392220.1 arylsulfatase J-like isoform X1 [Lingula anatina]